MERRYSKRAESSFERKTCLSSRGTSAASPTSVGELEVSLESRTNVSRVPEVAAQSPFCTGTGAVRRDSDSPSSEDHLRSAMLFHVGVGKGSDALITASGSDECNNTAWQFSAPPTQPTTTPAVDAAGCASSSRRCSHSQRCPPSREVCRTALVDIQDDGGAEVILCSTDTDERVLAVEQEEKGRSDRDRAATTEAAAQAAVQVSPEATAPRTERRTGYSLPSFLCALYTNCESTAAVTPEASPNPKSDKNWSCGNERASCRGGDDGDSSSGGSGILEQRQRSVEGTIESFLGVSRGSWCEGWQAWTLYMQGADTAALADPEDVRVMLRNRAGDLNARTRRIRRLRENMSPFDTAASGPPRHEARQQATSDSRANSRHSRMENAVGLRRSRSFPAKQSDSFRSATPNAEVAESVVSIVSSGIESLQYCGDDATVDIKRELNLPIDSFSAEVEPDDLCYDSDPGEVDSVYCRARRNRGSGSVCHRRQNTRRAVETFLKNGAWREEREGPNWRGQERLLGENSPSSKDDSAWNIVKNIIHKRMTLIWHQHSDNSSTRTSPLAVSAWIELGSHFGTNLIQPRLMWKPAHGHGDDDDKGGSLGVINHGVHAVDLLDISRVLEPNRIDRKRHPLAKRLRSILVETFDQSVLFEARSEEERDQIAEGLKLAVARLGSKVIVGDDSAFDEFFSTFATQTPGVPPKWAER